MACMAWFAAQTSGAAVRACAADVEYPPYLFVDRSDAGNASVRGVAAELLQMVLKRAGREPATIDRLPWMRCLVQAEGGDYDIVMNVPTAQIDPKPFWITEPYAVLHSVYFYSPHRHPQGVNILNLEDLKRYSVCGLMGNRYEAYGIDTAKVDTGARSYSAIVQKLDAGFCDVFLEKREVIDSLLARRPDLRAQFDSTSLVRRDLPEDEPPGLHFAISRHMAGGQSLQQTFNATIHALQADKALDRMVLPYMR